LERRNATGSDDGSDDGSNDGSDDGSSDDGRFRLFESGVIQVARVCGPEANDMLEEHGRKREDGT
jgi:hypothetical protein